MPKRDNPFSSALATLVLSEGKEDSAEATDEDGDTMGAEAEIVAGGSAVSDIVGAPRVVLVSTGLSPNVMAFITVKLAAMMIGC